MSEYPKSPVVKLSELPIGGSLTGIILRTPESQYGPFLVMDIDGVETVVTPSGNVKKFFFEDLKVGKRLLGVETTFTRGEDYNGNYKGKAYKSATFKVVQAGVNIASNPEQRAPKLAEAAVNKEDIKAQIEAAKAKRAAQANNEG